MNLFAYCGNNPIVREDDRGGFWNFVIGTVVGAAVGGITAAISSYKETGTIDAATVALSAAAGAVGGLIGASGIPAVGQAVASGLISAATNIGNSLIAGNEIDWVDIGIDTAIGSAASNKMASAAKNTIAKGINRVASGKNKFDSGSRYWKGAVKRGMSIIRSGVGELNFAQGAASVIGSEVSGIMSTAKIIIKGYVL